MNDLRLEFEWQDPAGARGEELRATWASLSIFIGNTPVTQLHDRRTKSVRTAVFLPLFPLAEWFAESWWFLQSEVERPEADGRRFDRRHNLRWAREGFVLPSLRFVALGEDVEVCWQRLDVCEAGVEFLADGNAILPRSAVYDAVGGFIDAVVARLDDQGVTATTLHEEWSAVRNADADEEAFCRASARLGIHPYTIDDRLATAIVEVAGKLRAELVDDFFSLASADALVTQADALAMTSEAIASDPDAVDVLEGVRRRAPNFQPLTTPWETGYRFAASLRQRLNGSNWKSRSLSDLAGHVGVDQLDHCLLPETGRCPFLDALAGRNRHGNPKFLIEKQREDSRQFAFCRALFEHLTSPSGQFAAVSSLRTHRQQTSRAFAAEFLAPHQTLKRDLSGTTVGGDEVEDLASEYGVSVFVIRHQIENHRLATVAL